MHTDRKKTGMKSKNLSPAKIEQTADLQRWFNDSTSTVPIGHSCDTVTRWMRSTKSLAQFDKEARDPWIFDKVIGAVTDYRVNISPGPEAFGPGKRKQRPNTMYAASSWRHNDNDVAKIGFAILVLMVVHRTLSGIFRTLYNLIGPFSVSAVRLTSHSHTFTNSFCVLSTFLLSPTSGFSLQE